MIRRFGFCRRSVPDDLQQTPVIEPVDPFQGGELHRLQTSPRAPRVNQLRLVQPDDRLGQGVDAPICQESVSVCQGGGKADSMVGHYTLIDLAGEEALEAADDVALGEALGGASSDIVDGRLM